MNHKWVMARSIRYGDIIDIFLFNFLCHTSCLIVVNINEKFILFLSLRKRFCPRVMTTNVQLVRFHICEIIYQIRWRENIHYVIFTHNGYISIKRCSIVHHILTHTSSRHQTDLIFASSLFGHSIFIILLAS